jgi:hypothetical protein
MPAPIGNQPRILGPDEVSLWVKGVIEFHKRDCKLVEEGDKTGGCTCSPAAQARRDARRATTWRGDSGIHAQAIIDQMIAMGEPTMDENEEYVGLTYARLLELLRELKELRDAKEVMASAYLHLTTMVDNVGHVLRRSGVMPK